jgi:hypothetical protein
VKSAISIGILLIANILWSQQVPSVLSNIYEDEKGAYYLDLDGEKCPEVISGEYHLADVIPQVEGTKDGLRFQFGKTFSNGLMEFGFIPYDESDFALPVYFKLSVRVEDGNAEIPIAKWLSGKFDMINWAQKGYGTLGYRLSNMKGELVYDGIVSFQGRGPFEAIPALIEGPFVNKLSHTSVVISFRTDMPVQAFAQIAGEIKESPSESKIHEFEFTDLQPASEYEYTVGMGPIKRTYSFKTAPKPGSRTSFRFAYASDSRNGAGRGERSLYGVNYYIVKRIFALAKSKESAFMQFSGDLVDGYLSDREAMKLQYANWKRAVEPFSKGMPFYAAMGNHESFGRIFVHPKKGYIQAVDRFPYATESAEQLFASEFCNPTNGPKSEDGSDLDPNKKTEDFPPYDETVFYYQYDNVAMVVLNSNYLYSTSQSSIPLSGGNPHAYIMDNQLDWFKSIMNKLNRDKTVDHIFLSLHTPFFPNGGHVSDDMWYNGSNDMRPIINGVKAKKGIIERRDELLEIFVNDSKKSRAILTGDEHNYCKTEIGPDAIIYPDDWQGKQIHLKRKIWQINNGAAGAPYYAQEQTPWTPFTSGFSTQNALVFIEVNGDEVRAEVYNPDTLEKLEAFEL